jgi:endonuclease/exonuclease/phosphatase family metal-dependent hydrolase
MKLVTWNTQWCKGLDGVVSPERIVSGAKAIADFDVLCLQEISVNYAQLTGDSALNQPQAIQALLPGFEVVFGPSVDEYVPGHGIRQQFGNLIASRLPILQIQHLALPSPVALGEPHHWMPRLCTICTVQAAWGPVRVMTTHLEYYSQSQRQSQAAQVRQWHQMACDQALRPPVSLPIDINTPYQTKPHTTDVILCGDFNFEPNSDEYQVITSSTQTHHFVDSWPLGKPNTPHPPTFRLYDDTYGPEPSSCDFIFVSESLAKRVKTVAADTQTQVSDHQPLYLELG